MTDPTRRDFLKTVPIATAVLIPKFTRDGPAVWNVEKAENTTSESDVIVRALRLWRPAKSLQVRGMEIAVSEHTNFLRNELCVRIILKTDQQPPIPLIRPIFATILNVSRQLLFPKTSSEVARVAIMIRDRISATDAFKWVEEGYIIPEC